MFRGKTDTNLQLCVARNRPCDHRAFDGAGVVLHGGACGGVVLYGRLNFRVELAPRGALAIEQLLPAQGLGPFGELFSRYALFLEIVKLVLQPVFSHPGAGFFDGVAVGDSIKGDAWGFHSCASSLNFGGYRRLGDNPPLYANQTPHPGRLAAPL